MHPRHLLRRTSLTAVAGFALLASICASSLVAPPQVAVAADNGAAAATADALQHRHASSTDVTIHTVASDPDDIHGRLDIERVADRVTLLSKTHAIVAYRVRTYTSWASQRLNATQRNFVLELNRDDERGSERNITVTSSDGVLKAAVISNATREVIATVTITRPDDSSFLITGPRRLIGARSYFWTSNYHAYKSHACGNLEDGTPLTCQDSVPDRGWIQLSWPAWPTSS